MLALLESVGSFGTTYALPKREWCYPANPETEVIQGVPRKLVPRVFVHDSNYTNVLYLGMLKKKSFELRWGDYRTSPESAENTAYRSNDRRTL